MTQAQQTSYLFTVTRYDSDPDRAATPLVLANNALAAGGDVLLWLTADGAEFGKKGAADGLVAKSFRRPPICSRASRRTAGAPASLL